MPFEFVVVAVVLSMIFVGVLMMGVVRLLVFVPNWVLMVYGGAPWFVVLVVGVVVGGGSFGSLFGVLPLVVGGDE